MMTPLQIEIALHYAVADGSSAFGCMGFPENVKPFVEAGLLTDAGETRLRPRYAATEGLRVYVAALCAVPLPVQTWVMPTVEEARVHHVIFGESVLDRPPPSAKSGA